MQQRWKRISRWNMNKFLLFWNNKAGKTISLSVSLYLMTQLDSLSWSVLWPYLSINGNLSRSACCLTLPTAIKVLALEKQRKYCQIYSWLQASFAFSVMTTNRRISKSSTRRTRCLMCRECKKWSYETYFDSKNLRYICLFWLSVCNISHCYLVSWATWRGTCVKKKMRKMRKSNLLAHVWVS